MAREALKYLATVMLHLEHCLSDFKRSQVANQSRAFVWILDVRDEMVHFRFIAPVHGMFGVPGGGKRQRRTSSSSTLDCKAWYT